MPIYKKFYNIGLSLTSVRAPDDRIHIPPGYHNKRRLDIAFFR